MSATEQPDSAAAVCCQQVEMSKDAEAQRQVCKNLVAEAITRNSKYVDKTLQLSNLPALTGYLFGSKKGADSMPVASSKWDSEVVAGTFDQLAKQVGARVVVAAKTGGV